MLVQYYLVDHSLRTTGGGKLRKGKVAAQCCHGALYAHEKALSMTGHFYQTVYMRWYTNDMAKIILLCTTSDLERALLEYPNASEVVDLGFTEIAPNTRTVVVLPVMPKDQAPEWVAQLSLL